MSLPTEVRSKYTSIIDTILSKADLTTISGKRIRQGIQDEIEYDITPQKAAIKALINERFDIFNAEQSRASEPVPSVETAEAEPAANGHTKPAIPSPSTSGTPAKRAADTDDSSDVVDHAPPTKKRKVTEDDDAAFAARLQAEEDKLARPTRGGASRKAAPSKTKKKKTPKKKSSGKAAGSDDSDVENDSTSGRKVNRETGFHKPMNLSPSLSELFGETRLSRPQVTKRIWAYIKENQLQDQADKRYIICDDKLRDLFKQDKVQMFTMTKLLNTHMYNPDE